jgi:hypothetical protein
MEFFCVCGHSLSEHREERMERHRKPDPVLKCRAVEPDKCSCQGYRPGKRSDR